MSLISRLIHKFPLKEYLDFKKNSWSPAGHFYSPLVSVDEAKSRQDEIWAKEHEEGITGINLRTSDQIKLIKGFKKFYDEMPFKSEKQDNLRYYFDNGFYSYTDGIILHAMIRNFNPERIIEIGSGFSSAVMLDTNELFFNNSISHTFIEPYPERLLSLLKEKDKATTRIIQQDVQSVPLETFQELEAGDILFFDGTHVAKTGSDVNYILFEVLPSLKSGVLIHIHDVFYPFEYPKEWVFEGRGWNEDYFLKAFLMYNDRFEITLFSEYIHKLHREAFKDMPLTYKNPGGNFWLLKK